MPPERASAVSKGTNRAAELVVITNTPTPYRTPFFNALSCALSAHGARLHVLYCALREPHRQWDVQLDEQSYSWTVLPGWHPVIREWNAHINPSVVRHLRTLHPTWILSDGAWNLPTVLMASQSFLAGNAYRIFWSESHARAVLHPRGPIAVTRRLALRSYDAFAVPNEASARFVRAEARDRTPVFLLPNTVDEDAFIRKPAANRTALRNRLGLTETATVIVCVARLEERKGVLDLASGYERLAAHLRANTVLVFVGDGSLRATLETRARALASGEIRVVGHMEKPAIRDWLWAADAYALATRRDPNPLSVIEAAFAALPLIVSREAGNVDELCHHGVNGFVLERPGPDSVAMVLQRFLSLGELDRRDMGARSLDLANHSFRRADVAQRFVQDLVSARASR